MTSVGQTQMRKTHEQEESWTPHPPQKDDGTFWKNEETSNDDKTRLVEGEREISHNTRTSHVPLCNAAKATP